MKIHYFNNNDTIVALATPQGSSAIAVIRVSGKDSIAICDYVFKSKKYPTKQLSKQKSHTIHFGEIFNGDIVIDEVLISLFKAPNTYSGEDIVEISCHGSVFIQQQILQLLMAKGARLAKPGEYTLRAFKNGKMDLLQAEAVADLIESNSSLSHQLAMKQMRGGYSEKIKTLRENLMNFASLIELELDFSEEDVEFANRNDLKNLVWSIQKIITRLVQSFEVGNAIKNGIPVAIVGKPNAGKSTLLNTLLNEDKAIVSEIPGTTRDAIEDEFVIDGVLFRFIDTAGISDTVDIIEAIGVAKTFEKISQSSIVIYLFDVHEITSKELSIIIDDLKKKLNNAQLIIVGNKIDKEDFDYTVKEFEAFKDILFISAKEKRNISELKKRLVELFDNKAMTVPETIVTNVRHLEAFNNTSFALEKVLEGLDTNISSEFLAIDVKRALHYLGEVTGDITTEDLLENIFSRFCIGK